MTRYLPLAFLLGLAAELISLIWAGSALGIGITMLLLVLGGVVGIGLIRSAGSSIAQALRSPVQATSLSHRDAGRALAHVLSGLLFLVPGFFSDVIGLLLLLPSVRRWLRSTVKVVSYSPARPSAGDGTVIDAEAIEITGEIMSSTPADGQNADGKKYS